MNPTCIIVWMQGASAVNIYRKRQTPPHRLDEVGVGGRAVVGERWRPRAGVGERYGGGITMLSTDP